MQSLYYSPFKKFDKSATDIEETSPPPRVVSSDDDNGTILKLEANNNKMMIGTSMTYDVEGDGGADEMLSKINKKLNFLVAICGGTLLAFGVWRGVKCYQGHGV